MRLHPTALTLMTLMLAACGGSDKSSSGSSGGGTVTPVATARDIIVTPALGVVTQGKVTVKSLDGTPIDTQFTNVSGEARITVPAGVDAVIIEVTGTDATRYFDEAVPDTLQAFPAAYTMRAMSLVSYDEQPIAVSTLTEAAYRYAQTTLGGITRVNIVQGNDFIERFFSIDNILTPPVAIDALNDFLSLPVGSARGRAATNYALMLTALSQLAASRTTPTDSPALRLMKELSEDLADGQLNNASALTYIANNLPNGLKTAQNAYFYILASHGVTYPDDSATLKPIKDHIESYQFRINSVPNTNNPETDPETGSGTNTNSGSLKVTPNITAADIAGLVGSYTGTSLNNHPCTMTVIADGTFSLVDNGMAASSAKMDGGAEDLRRQSFDAKALLTGTLYMAKTSTTSTTATFVALDGVNRVRLAGEIDEKTSKVSYACAIPLPSSP